MKVLFLEDDPARIRKARQGFVGHSLIVAETAAEAIRHLQEIVFDLVSLDHDLDGKVMAPSDEYSGFAVAKVIAEMEMEIAPTVIIHTYNPSAAREMKLALIHHNSYRLLFDTPAYWEFALQDRSLPATQLQITEDGLPAEQGLVTASLLTFEGEALRVAIRTDGLPAFESVLPVPMGNETQISEAVDRARKGFWLQGLWVERETRIRNHVFDKPSQKTSTKFRVRACKNTDEAQTVLYKVWEMLEGETRMKPGQMSVSFSVEETSQNKGRIAL